jgi:putative RNA 2'-phosphotransferase
MIRACQGHSTSSVTTSSMEDTWTPIDTEGIYLYHGTKSSNVESILRSGLNSGTRTHVHLAESPNSNIGKRYNVDTLLKIDGTKLKQLGVKVYRSSNGMLLAQSIPVEAITIM